MTLEHKCFAIYASPDYAGVLLLLILKQKTAETYASDSLFIPE